MDFYGEAKRVLEHPLEIRSNPEWRQLVAGLISIIDANDQRSIEVMVHPETADVSVRFRPQKLLPIQYGTVIAAVIAHIAKGFKETNPDIDITVILEQIGAGISGGLNMLQMEPPQEPQKPH